PKTPVFDSGCRPAECFLLLAGGHYSPAAYKIGLAVCCALAPLLLALAARALSLSRAAAFFPALLGMLVWWGVPWPGRLAAGPLARRRRQRLPPRPLRPPPVPADVARRADHRLRRLVRAPGDRGAAGAAGAALLPEHRPPPPVGLAPRPRPRAVRGRRRQPVLA